MNLGVLKSIDLREVWQHEEYDFSKWLSQEDNLGLLSDEIGIGFTDVQVEAPAGRYSVDILAKEEGTERKIIIENQLEISNHDHLGKIITYAAGYDADIVIWLVKDCREEHKQAVDWLNENTSSKINIFLIKIEVWQIEGSPYAVKFNLISQPNDWSKTLKDNTKNSEISGIKLRQLEFWNRFNEYAKSKDTRLKLRKAQPQQWYDISYGSTVSHISITVNSQTKKVGYEIYIPASKAHYKYLLSNKESIESLFEKINFLKK